MVKLSSLGIGRGKSQDSWIDHGRDYSNVNLMITISKSRLKAEMLSVFRQLERSGGELVVTDRGRAVLKISSLVPPKARVESVFADVAGKVVYHEDILAPTSGEWPEI